MRGKKALEHLRKEIEADTKAARSEPERLARWRDEKLQGPREPVRQKPLKEKGVEIER